MSRIVSRHVMNKSFTNGWVMSQKEWVMSQKEWVMSCTMNGTHMCHTTYCVMGHVMNISHVTHRMSHVTEWVSHVTHKERVMSPRMSHVIWYSHVTNEWVMSHNKWVMSQNERVMSHTTNESCHIEWVIWYDIVMSLMNESCHTYNESCHRMNQSWHIQGTSHVTSNESYDMIWSCHEWMSHVT